MSNESVECCCEECGTKTDVNWYCPGCGGALCDKCNTGLKLHAKNHGSVVRKLKEGRRVSDVLSELREERTTLEHQITETVTLGATARRCISERFSVLKALLDAKEKEFTTEAERLAAQQKDILCTVDILLDKLAACSAQQGSEKEGSAALSSAAAVVAEGERLLRELRGPTGAIAQGQRLTLSLSCAATTGLREAARISTFIGTLDAEHVTFPLITDVTAGDHRTCYGLEISWTTDIPDMGLMTYQLGLRRVDSPSPSSSPKEKEDKDKRDERKDEYTLVYEGKERGAAVMDLMENSEYGFRVRVSYDGKLWSPWTAESRGRTLPLPCPEKIVATHSPTSVALSWTAVKAHTARECTYQVAYRDEDFNETKYKDNPATVQSGATTWTVSGLVPQKLYMFSVRTEFDGSWSEWSPEVEVVTQIPRPSDLTTLNITPTSVSVSWSFNNREGLADEKKCGKKEEEEEEKATGNKCIAAAVGDQNGPGKKGKKDKRTDQERAEEQQKQPQQQGKKKGKRKLASPSPLPPQSQPQPQQHSQKKDNANSTTNNNGKGKKETLLKGAVHIFQAELTNVEDGEVVGTYTGEGAQVTFEGLTPETKYAIRVRAEWDGVWGEWCDSLEIETEWSKYFKWAPCPSTVKRKRAYAVDDQRGRVATACTSVDGDEHCTVLGAAPFIAGCTTRWEVRILKSRGNNGNLIYVGVAPADMSQDNEKSISHGWFFSCYKSALFSGKPQNFWCKEYGPRKTNGEYVHTGDSVCASMDMSIGSLSFSLKGNSTVSDLGVAFECIPLDKPLVPAVIMFNCGDAVEFI